jgi:diketogulonate reductase-like aldo/keto reductase
VIPRVVECATNSEAAFADQGQHSKDKGFARLATDNTVVTSVILGAKRLEQLQDNLAAMELKLTDDEIKLLDEVSGAPEYPSWMFPVQSAGRLGAPDRPV